MFQLLLVLGLASALSAAEEYDYITIDREPAYTNLPACARGPDFTSAAVLYDSYCSAAGFPGPGIAFKTPTVSPPPTVLATPTGNPGGREPAGREDEATTPTVTRTSIVTQTVGAGSISSSKPVTTSSTSLPVNQGTIDSTSTGLVSKDNNTAGDASGDGGLSMSDKIALGVGIGIGLPATIAGVWTCFHFGSYYRIYGFGGAIWRFGGGLVAAVSEGVMN
ncbi:hypothetical protein V8F20_010998 [Naviculisporaceae sp. PSN 640]